jgi:hypothetical protein
MAKYYLYIYYIISLLFTIKAEKAYEKCKYSFYCRKDQMNNVCLLK